MRLANRRGSIKSPDPCWNVAFCLSQTRRWNYLRDQQRARLARFIGRSSFEGVKAHPDPVPYRERNIPPYRYYWLTRYGVNSDEYRCAVQFGGLWWKNVIRNGYGPAPQRR